MYILVASILSSSSLLIFFKLFEKYRVNSLQAITVNYIAAAACGLFFISSDFVLTSKDWPWYLAASILGCLFAIIFNLSRYTAQKLGIGITSIAMKLGLVFPVLIGILLYNEEFRPINYIGVALGFIAIFLINAMKKNDQEHVHKWLYLLPMIVWIGSGLCDSTVQLANKKFNTASTNGSFAFICFWSAGMASFTFTYFRKEPWSYKSLAGGICLGIPNYFSIYFLLASLKVMRSDFGLSSSYVFLINNISVVVMSVLIGMIFFKERLRMIQILGLVLAIISLIIIGIK